MSRALLDYPQELESFEHDAFPLARTAPRAGFLGEDAELELAASLLEATDESELERFIGDLIGRTGRAAGGAVRTPVARALGGILKAAARQALPALARAPGLPADRAAWFDARGPVAAAAGKYFGLELEGLSPEDQEFEAARSFVRFAADAARNAVGTPAAAPPGAAARAAAIQAARRHAPGLLPEIPRPPAPVKLAPVCTGRWVRRGRDIVIINY